MQPALDVIGQLERGPAMPVGGNALEIERREFALQLVLEGEIELRRLAGLAMAQDGLGFARIVVAVVVEEDDLAADLRLQPPGGLDFGDQEPLREEPARLLAETDDGGGGHGVGNACAGVAVGPSAAWMTRLNSTQAAQPMKLYQR